MIFSLTLAIFVCFHYPVPYMEQTLVLVKPDGVQRGLVGEILGRFERAGLKITALKMVHASHEDVDQHYAITEEWMKGVYDKAKSKYTAHKYG